MAGNANFDALLSTTLKKYTPKLTDNIFSNVPILYWLREGDRIQKVDGGEQLVEPLLYASNSTAGSYAGYDSIGTTPQEGITAAAYDWKQYAVTVAISGIEEAKNSGESAVINLLDSKVQQAEMTVEENFGTMLYSDGSGNGGKDWHGLQLIVPDNPTTGTVGGIDRSTETWWRSKVESTVATLTTAFMSNMFNTVSRGSIKPDYITTTQALFESYEALLQPQLRFEDPKVGDAGFQNLLYKSTPVVFDTFCPSGHMYFLNSRFLKLKVHSRVWFKNTPFEKPHGQDARYSQILSYGNLVTSNSRHQGVLTGKS